MVAMNREPRIADKGTCMRWKSLFVLVTGLTAGAASLVEREQPTRSGSPAPHARPVHRSSSVPPPNRVVVTVSSTRGAETTKQAPFRLMMLEMMAGQHGGSARTHARTGSGRPGLYPRRGAGICAYQGTISVIMAQSCIDGPPPSSPSESHAEPNEEKSSSLCLLAM